MMTVLQLEVQVLVEPEVQAGGIHVVAGVGLAVGAELVPLGVHLEPVDHGDAHRDVQGVGGAALLLLAGESRRILGADRPVVDVILEAGAEALALEGLALAVHPVALPTESAEIQALDRLDLERADDVLRLVGVGQIDALTVVHAQLIVEQAVLVIGHRDQVALDLDTLVAAAHVGFAETVAHAGHLLDQEGVVAHAHVPGVHRVLEGESALELADLHGELLVLGPLHVEILRVRTGSIDLELDAVFEVIENAAVHIQTDQAAVEAGAAMGAFLVAVLVAADDVGAKLGLAHEIGHLVAVFGFLVLLRESGETERGHEGRQ